MTEYPRNTEEMFSRGLKEGRKLAKNWGPASTTVS